MRICSEPIGTGLIHRFHDLEELRAALTAKIDSDRSAIWQEEDYYSLGQLAEGTTAEEKRLSVLVMTSKGRAERVKCSQTHHVLRFGNRVPMSKAQSEALDTTMNNCEGID